MKNKTFLLSIVEKQLITLFTSFISQSFIYSVIITFF